MVPDMNETNIAVLGYATHCSEFNKEIAFDVGRLLALRGFIVCSGNITGTFIHAFKGAKSVKGHTVAILENTQRTAHKPFCDDAIYALDTDAKHTLISEKCQAAIVIGGGEGTKKLINRFIHLNKDVIAIKGSGGAVNSKLNGNVRVLDNLELAVSELIR